MMVASTSKRFPFTSYPIGWYFVARAQDVPAGRVLPVQLCGQDVVLYRTESGTAHALDAHCPHLGAHLGYGGKVQGESIRCPFHGWRWDGSGACVEIPYASHIPKNAVTRPWPLIEHDGFILLNHGADAETPNLHEVAMPTWNGAVGWTPFVELSWRVRSHPQEVLENLIDLAHLTAVHPGVFAGHSGCTVEAVDRVFRSSVRVTTLFPSEDGTTLECPVVTQTENHGLGCSYMHVQQGDFQSRQVFFLTPLMGEEIDMRAFISIKNLADAGMTQHVLEVTKAMTAQGIEQDMPIWERKAFKARPVLCAGDGPIGEFRRWARKFYSADTSIHHEP